MSENECPYKQDVYCNKAISNIIYCNYNFDEHCKPYKPLVITNADRIRSMSDEELSELLENIYECGEYGEARLIEGTIIDCGNIKDWLKQPYTETDR